MKADIEQCVEMRLSGWQRLGIVASFLWMLGTTIYALYDMGERRNGFMMVSYQLCADRKEEKDFDFAHRIKQAKKMTEDFRIDWKPFLSIVVAAPIFLAWLLLTPSSSLVAG